MGNNNSTKNLCHHGGKMGDLVMALPTIRAMARIYGSVDLITSPLCHQLVPLLWEQPYLNSVEVDDTREYKADGRILLGWDYFKKGEGLNLSIQPKFHQEEYRGLTYTECYAKHAGVGPILPEDRMALPSLVNHRRWIFSAEVKYDGVPQWHEPFIVVAPECESVDMLSQAIWQKVIDVLALYYRVVVIGKGIYYSDFDECIDLRGMTTVPVIARMISESYGFIGGHSFPWHLARHSETPAVCLQDITQELEKSTPTDTDCCFYKPEYHNDAIEYLLEKAKRVNPFMSAENV